jgi:hypothetical protein
VPKKRSRAHLVTEVVDQNNTFTKTFSVKKRGNLSNEHSLDKIDVSLPTSAEVLPLSNKPNKIKDQNFKTIKTED